METVETEVERFASLFDFSQHMLGCVSVLLAARGPLSAGSRPPTSPEALLSRGLAQWGLREPRWVSASTQPDRALLPSWLPGSLLAPRLRPAGALRAQSTSGEWEEESISQDVYACIEQHLIQSNPII